MPSSEQPTLFDLLNTKDFPISQKAATVIKELSVSTDSEARGAIFTRAEVVDFILDLVGYSSDKYLYQKCILEPSFGNGDFLLAIVDRVIESWEMHSLTKDITELKKSILAIELHKQSVEDTRNMLIKKLVRFGFSNENATDLTVGWLFQGDFLLEAPERKFDFIVGNPPYVRQELIPATLLAEYKNRFSTMYDRADLYIPFIEKSLYMLNDEGLLGFICADRWMKNKYGGPLRKFISDNFSLLTYVDMINTDAFTYEVSAYPAITIIGRQKSEKTRVLKQPKIEKKYLAEIASEIIAPTLKTGSVIKEIRNVVNGCEPWLLESTDQMTLIRRIENEYPAIEEAGCKVGIGVATGADKAFIGKYESLDVEEDRKLRLVRTKDIKIGEVVWQGDGVINPFDSNGKLVNLDSYPKLKNYLQIHKDIILNRHCAKKSPSNWYRTIDRIWSSLTYQPKLLIPDIKGESHIVFESGEFYPHHNLYYITSEFWDLRALQAVLLSSISKLFVSVYSTKMRGGYLRFQAQYLRRIRLPMWADISESIKAELSRAGSDRNIDACNRVAYTLYGLSEEEKATIGGNGE